LGGGRWLHGYIQGKLLGDPVFNEGLTALQGVRGPLLDLGCGLGLFGFWINLHGLFIDYKGCDIGGWKIAAGQKAALKLGYPMELSEVNLLDFSLEKAGVICAFDILHYLPLDQQEVMVHRLASAARNGSLVLIRNGVRDCGWRSCMTLLEEWWTRATGWIQGGSINFPRLNHLIEVFESEGCIVEAKPLWGKTPFSSYWLTISSRR
jgi:SAM-dependent methyltransferase